MNKKTIFLLITLFISCILSAQLRYSINFSKENVKVKDINEDQNKIKAIEYDSLSSDFKVGFPLLPYKYLMFYISDNQNDLGIKILKIQKETMGLEAKIQLAPTPIPSSNNANILFVDSINMEKFNPNLTYPELPVSIVSDGFIDGNIRVIIVRVSPIQYKEADLLAVLNTSIDFEIIPIKNATLSLKRNIINPKVIRKSMFANSLQMENKNEFLKTHTNITSNASLRSTSTISLPVYEYTVITSESLAPSFEKLVSWKRMKGFSAGVVTMQSILNEPDIIGDEISGIYDDAGKLRSYLSYAWQNGAIYVLLGGQDSIVPVRYGSGEDNNSTLEATIPTDLYYSDLNGNWNYDNDSFYGEKNGDIIDYNPELYVGRILCKNSTEVDNYTNKLLRYERNPGNGDYSYLNKAFYSVMDELQQYNQAKYIALRFSSIFNTYDIYQENPSWDDPSPTFPTGQDVITKMNERYGLFGWFGHGDVYGISTLHNAYGDNSYWKGITSIDSYQGGFQEELGNGLDSLTNKYYPAIAYACACRVVPYDKYNYSTVPYSFGESFTLAGDYGGPAFLGNTRVSYAWYVYLLFQKFIESLDASNYHLGSAEAKSKLEYTLDFKHWMALTHNLIGCPELQMWSTTPTMLGSITTSESNNAVNVTTSNSNHEISISGLFGGLSYHDRIIGNSATFIDLPANFVVTVNKHNNFTYIAPILIQNEQISGSNYLYANQVDLGSNVTSERTNGNVVITNGSSLTIETSSVVNLSPGFSVLLGGRFEIINK